MDNLINFEGKKTKNFNPSLLVLVKAEICKWNTLTHTGKHENKGQKWKLEWMAYFPNILSSYETLIFTNN